MSDGVVSTSMDDVPLSASWNAKFEILEKIGARDIFYFKATASPEFKALSFKERLKVGSNFLAFFFGPFYYFSKKMWHKGTLILGASWAWAALLTVIESVAGKDLWGMLYGLPGMLYWGPPAVICSQLANYDYYRYVRKDEKVWAGIPGFLLSPIGAVAFPITALLLLVVAIGLSPIYLKEINEQTLSEISGVWRGDSDGAMISIDLNGKTKTLNINQIKFPVVVENIDRENHIVVLGVSTNSGGKARWAIRQIFDEDNRFTLSMTLHDGTQDTLSFVRNP